VNLDILYGWAATNHFFRGKKVKYRDVADTIMIGPTILRGVTTNDISLVEQGLLAGEPVGSWLRLSAAHGSLNILKAAYAGGYPMTEYLHAVAATNGRLETLKWMHDVSVPVSEFSWVGAITSGKSEILEWMYSAGYRMNERAVAVGVLSNNRVVRKWVLEHSGA
jgi:hypothetical protein